MSAAHEDTTETRGAFDGWSLPPPAGGWTRADYLLVVGLLLLWGLLTAAVLAVVAMAEGDAGAFPALVVRGGARAAQGASPRRTPMDRTHESPVIEIDAGAVTLSAEGAAETATPRTTKDGRTRARVEKMWRYSRRKLLEGAIGADRILDEIPIEDRTRPRTYAECERAGLGTRTPCPFVSCTAHLYLDVNPENGSIQLNFPDRDVDALRETCAIAVANRGVHSTAAVGAALNVTGQNVRLMFERKVFPKLQRLHGARRIAELLSAYLWSRAASEHDAPSATSASEQEPQASPPAPVVSRVVLPPRMETMAPGVVRTLPPTLNPQTWRRGR